MFERITTSATRPFEFSRLGLMEYKRALALQQKALDERIQNPDAPDCLLFVEHLPVYTLGRRGGRENLVVSEDFLAGKGIEIIQTDRGGNITYHGPGQAVLYPVIHLEENGLSVKDFVWGLEEIMKRTALDMGVKADRDPRNHGLWVADQKIGSVGISIKRGVSIHGLALNINPDLTPFSWINPCGMANQAMTSIAREKGEAGLDLDRQFDRQGTGALMDRACDCLVRHFSTLFNIEVNHV